MSNSDPDSQIRERTRTVLPLDHLIRVTRNERSYTMYSGRDIGHRLLMQAGELKRKNAMKKTSYLCWDVEYVTTEDCEEEETDGLAVDDAFDIDWSTERRPVHRRMKVESAGSDMDDKIKDAIRSISLSGTARISVTNADEPTKGCPMDIYLVALLDDVAGSQDGSSAFCMRIKFSKNLTVGNLWEKVALAKRQSCEHLQSKYIMTYTIQEGRKKIKYQLLNEVQFLFQTHLYSCWYDNVDTVQDIPVVIEKPPNVGRQERELLSRMGGLLGCDFDVRVHPHSIKSNFCNSEEFDIYLARRSLQSYVQDLVDRRSPEDYTLSMDTESTDLNNGIKSKIPESERKDMHFHYKNEDFTESINVFMAAEDVMKIIVIPAFFPDDLDQNAKSKEFCFRLSGEEMFISGSTPMIDFTIIRRLIFREEEIHLLVISKPNPAKDKVSAFVWPRLDPLQYHVCEDADMNDIRSSVLNHMEFSSISAWSCKGYFNLRVEGLTMPFTSKYKSLRKDSIVNITSDTAIQVHLSLHHGEKCLVDGLTTSFKKISRQQTIVWGEKISTKIRIQDIPKETKLMVVVKAKGSSKETLYWGNFNIVDVNSNALKEGHQVLYLWPSQVKEHTHGHLGPNPILPAINNQSWDAPRLSLHLETRTVNVVYPEDVPHSFNRKVQNGLNTVGMKFPIKDLPDILTKTMDWRSKESVGAVHQLISVVRAKNDLPFEMAFRLLDSDIADSEVRKLAVEKLKIIPIPDMKYYMLQLVQAIKFERRHDNPLCRLLLKTALSNKSFGSLFFWCIRSDLCQPLHRMRFCIMLEAYLRGCGEDMLTLFEDQIKIHSSLNRIGIQLKAKDINADNRNDMLEAELKGEKLEDVEFKPLYNPRLSLGTLDIANAKCMTSKKKPIWLGFQNTDATNLSRNITHNMIVKHGDDLRQDMLVLRMMALIDRIWQEDDLDLHLIPYKCIATSCNSGVIEVVNGETIADISPKASGREIYQWIRKHHLKKNGDVDLDRFHQAVVTFTKSLAGYSVVTFVLGITDRHNDNIMITKDGNIFHIDFGHILGNVKKFMGISREWTPFILSPDFMYVMGGQDSVYFESFRKYCILGFLSLRRRANFVLNLFRLMRHSGIPELTSLNELKHVRDSLYLDKATEKEAEKAFNSDIDKSLSLNWTTVLNWWAHVKHKSISSSSSS